MVKHLKGVVGGLNTYLWRLPIGKRKFRDGFMLTDTVEISVYDNTTSEDSISWCKSYVFEGNWEVQG